MLYISDDVKYVNTAVNPLEEYSVPNQSKPIPKYLEIIYDENDDQPLPVRPYEIPLPPLDESEINSKSSPTLSAKSAAHQGSSSVDVTNTNSIKSRTLSNSSTVSETSVYNPPKKKQLLNVSSEDNIILTVTLPNSNEDCTSKEKLLLPQQSNHDFNQNKLQEMYANANIETAIRSCDGITSM